MSDETKPDAGAASPASAPSAVLAPAAGPAPAASGPAGPALDWSSMMPEDASGLAFDVLKLALLFLVIANGIGVSKGTGLTASVAALGALGAAGVLAVWKAYKVLVEAFDRRAIGATYGVLGAAAGIWVLVSASSSGTVHESRELRVLVGLVGLLFLYPAGLGLMTAAKGETLESANPLGIPFDRSWFSTLWVLYSKEVRSFFTTAVPYLVFFVFMLLNGILYFAFLRYLTQPGTQCPPPTQIFYNNFVFWLSMWIICPAVTMRLVAEEHRMGTVETLLTAPVTDIQVVLSKFGAAFTFYAIMLGTTLAHLATLTLYSKDWDWGPVFSGYLGLALVGALYLSIGLFWSTLTQSQIVAFIFAAGSQILLFLPGLVSNFVKDEKVRDFIKYVNMQDHYHEMLMGIVTTRSLVFFGSLILLFLFCSIRGLETQKWK